jgi:hypothetical protein
MLAVGEGATTTGGAAAATGGGATFLLQPVTEIEAIANATEMRIRLSRSRLFNGLLLSLGSRVTSGGQPNYFGSSGLAYGVPFGTGKFIFAVEYFSLLYNRRTVVFGTVPEIVTAFFPRPSAKIGPAWRTIARAHSTLTHF